MTFIKRLILENFQSHEYTEIEFSEGLNVIVGPSDQGKSALIRALKWVLYNEPRGLDFIRHGTSFARITVEFGSSAKVIRERSVSRNRYTIIDPDGTETVFEGFGSEVPEEVVKVHGIRKVRLDSDLNTNLILSDQLEGPFLLSQTGAVRAKALGRLSGVHIIDRALRDTISDLRRETQNGERLKKEIEEVDLRLKDFEGLHDIREKTEKLEEIFIKLEEDINKLEKLEFILKSLKQLSSELQEVKNHLTLLEVCPEIEVSLARCQVSFIKFCNLKKVSDGLYKITGELENAREITGYLKAVPVIDSILQKGKLSYDRFTALNSIKEKLTGVEHEAEKINNIMVRFPEESVGERFHKTLLEKLELLNKLLALTTKYNSFKGEEEKILNELPYTKGCRGAESLVTEANDRIERLISLTRVLERLKAAESGLYSEKKSIEELDAEIESQLEAYSDRLSREGKCPYCGSRMDHEKLEEIISSYKSAE